jgi:hypothetical protein
VILLIAVLLGLLAGGVRAWYGGRHFTIPDLHLPWLAAVAFVPQWLAFFGSATRSRFSDRGAAVALVTSQLLLSAFGLANHHPAFKLLILGLLLNLAVITANGGLMPISPETVRRLLPDTPDERWQSGKRFGHTKDRVLAEADTTFPWLSDRFILAGWLPNRVAYSVGDILLAVGACWFLWAAGGASPDDAANP